MIELIDLRIQKHSNLPSLLLVTQQASDNSRKHQEYFQKYIGSRTLSEIY